MRAATLSDEARELLLTVLPPDRVHAGFVPDRLPEDSAGYVLPYAVLFMGLGGDLPAERSLCGGIDAGTRDVSLQINCCGPTADHALRLADDVYQALVNQRLGNHWIKPDADALRVAFPILDREPSPARFFLPVQLRITTN